MNGYVLELNFITRYVMITNFIQQFKVTGTNCAFKRHNIK